MKTCRVCHRELPFTLFYRRSDNNKYRSECKDCKVKAIKARDNLTRRAARIQTQRRWRKNNPEASKQHSDKYRAKAGFKQRLDKHKMAVRSKVNEKIRLGHLESGTQCRYGNGNCYGRIEAHHCDYNKPLDIEWMCVIHHKAWHRVFIADHPDD